MKTLKRISSAVLALVFALAFACPAFAQSGTYIHDEYGILTDEQFTSMEAQAASISESNDIGVYLWFCSSIDEDNRTGEARGYYFDNGLGLGEDQSGIMLTVAIDSRDYVTVANERGTDTYMPYCSYIEDTTVVPLLAQDQFADAAQAYLDVCQEIASGTVSDSYYEDDYYNKYSENSGVKTLGDYLMNLAIALVIGIAVAAIVCFGFYSQMKTAKEKAEANDYLDKNSFKLSRKKDQFLHSTVTKTPKPKDDNNSGGGGGGFSSSGGGKF